MEPTNRRYTADEIAILTAAQKQEAEKLQESVNEKVERLLRQWCVEQAVKVCPVDQPVTTVTVPEKDEMHDVVTIRLISDAILDFVKERRQ